MEKVIYCGHEIRTKKNGEGHVSLIYNGETFIGGTCDDLTENGRNSVEKAMMKIDAKFLINKINKK